MSASSNVASDKSPQAFRTISEVSEDLDLPQHVLRFWETKFTQIKPMKRGGGRRLYRPDHIALLRGIKALLYDDGMTIKGVQKMLREKGAKTVIARGKADAALSLEPTDTAPVIDGMLPLDLPEDTSERLQSLRRKASATRAQGTDADKIRQSITRLEALLAQLESRPD
ncbi:MAG: MerR family transcriptional regulator [Paracoccaceae bacterium]